MKIKILSKKILVRIKMMKMINQFKTMRIFSMMMKFIITLTIIRSLLLRMNRLFLFKLKKMKIKVLVLNSMMIVHRVMKKIIIIQTYHFIKMIMKISSGLLRRRKLSNVLNPFGIFHSIDIGEDSSHCRIYRVNRENNMKKSNILLLMINNR